MIKMRVRVKNNIQAMDGEINYKLIGVYSPLGLIGNKKLLVYSIGEMVFDLYYGKDQNGEDLFDGDTVYTCNNPNRISVIHFQDGGFRLIDGHDTEDFWGMHKIMSPCL